MVFIPLIIRMEFSIVPEEHLFLNEKRREIYLNGIKGRLREYSKCLGTIAKKADEIHETSVQKDEIENECLVLQNTECTLKKETEEFYQKLEQNKADSEGREKKLAACRKNVDLYKKHFGMKITKLGQSGLSFVFTQIDPENPSDCAAFNLVVEDSIYKVPMCSPEIEELDQFLYELNKCNNLSEFVRKMRQTFCRYVS